MRLGVVHFVTAVPGLGKQCDAGPGVAISYIERPQGVRIKLDGQPEIMVPLHNIAAMGMPPEAQ